MPVRCYQNIELVLSQPHGWRSLPFLIRCGRDLRQQPEHGIMMRQLDAVTGITLPDHKSDFGSFTDKGFDQPCGQRNRAFELLVELLFPGTDRINMIIENNGDMPIVVARKFANHQRGSLRRRFPVDVMMMITRQIRSNRIQVASRSLRAAFYLSLGLPDQHVKLFMLQRRGIDDDVSICLNKTALLNKPQWKSRSDKKSFDRIHPAL